MAVFFCLGEGAGYDLGLSYFLEAHAKISTARSIRIITMTSLGRLRFECCGFGHLRNTRAFWAWRLGNLRLRISIRSARRSEDPHDCDFGNAYDGYALVYFYPLSEPLEANK